MTQLSEKMRQDDKLLFSSSRITCLPVKRQFLSICEIYVVLNIIFFFNGAILLQTIEFSFKDF